MELGDDLAEETIEVVLRIPDQSGIIDTTDRETLETETRLLIFKRDAKRGIGELTHHRCSELYCYRCQTIRVVWLWHMRWLFQLVASLPRPCDEC